MRLTPLEKEMLRRAGNFALAGEWPWEPEKQQERGALLRAIEKLGSSTNSETVIAIAKS